MAMYNLTKLLGEHTRWPQIGMFGDVVDSRGWEYLLDLAEPTDLEPITYFRWL